MIQFSEKYSKINTLLYAAILDKKNKFPSRILNFE